MKKLLLVLVILISVQSLAHAGKYQNAMTAYTNELKSAIDRGDLTYEQALFLENKRKSELEYMQAVEIQRNLDNQQRYLATVSAIGSTAYNVQQQQMTFEQQRNANVASVFQDKKTYHMRPNALGGYDLREK